MGVRQVLWGTGFGASLALGVLAARSSVLWNQLGSVDSPVPALDPEESLSPEMPVPDEREPGSGVAAEREAVAVASLQGGVSPRPSDTVVEEPIEVPPLITPEGNAKELHPETFLGALSKETRIFAKPSAQSKLLGFARTGTLLRRALRSAGAESCKGGWYHVEPEGYVCVGQAATLDMEHPILQIASYQPDRSLPMPYIYGKSRYPTPPLYTRIPTKDQQQIAEQDLRGHLRKNFGANWAAHADTPPPQILAQGERVPRPFGYPRLERDFMTGRALGNSAFAFIDLFESEGRRYGLTADLSILPLDRLTLIEPSQFAGKILPEGASGHVAFTRSSSQRVYEGDPDSGPLRIVRPAGYRESFLLTGRKVRSGGATFHETEDGQFLKEDERLVRIEPKERAPKWATGKRSWIDVSLLKQTLVVYEGMRPVFATLVSTGRDGIADPKTTYATVQGLYRIHTKHVTSTMSGNNADDEFDLRDVPYVQYFHEGYAFHAAFWHDGFGGPRSHGCINLSPADARTLFTLTDPPVPLRWHSALSLEGSLVHIHP